MFPLVKLIMGQKGTGKTKKLVDLVIAAVSSANGDVVVIEKDKKLTYDIPYQARLIDAGEYGINSYPLLKGFISGLHAGNYDITHFFIDNFFKLVNDSDPADLPGFMNWLEQFSNRENIECIISVSADEASCPEELKKFLL